MYVVKPPSLWYFVVVVIFVTAAQSDQDRMLFLLGIPEALWVLVIPLMSSSYVTLDTSSSLISLSIKNKS